MMEEQLVQRCKAGDLSAYEDVYSLYGNKLYGLCLRMSGNPSDAEDLLQEVFILLIKKIQSFRGEAKFSTWLHRITVNTCINFLRKKKKTVDIDEQPELEAKSISMPEHREALKKAIAQLPDGYRSVVILHDIQGYNHQEVGDILNITAGASKSQLFKARRKLREMVVAETNTPSSGKN